MTDNATTHDSASPAARASRPQTGPSPKDTELDIALEEAALCDQVVDHLKNNSAPSQITSRVIDDQALIELRDQIADSHLEDVPALVAQMERVSAVATRRSQPSTEVVDPANPYFGHLRLEEEGRPVRDVLIGKGTRIDPRQGIRIVDWRHAPISQLFYRYDEGAEYEEIFGDREAIGRIQIRRTVTIVDGELQRVAAPQGVFVRRDTGWRKISNSTASLQGGEGAAVRASHIRGVLGAGDGIEQREDRHLPEIAALLDPRQFELISRPDAGLVVIQGGAGSGKNDHRCASHGVLGVSVTHAFRPQRTCWWWSAPPPCASTSASC